MKRQFDSVTSLNIKKYLYTYKRKLIKKQNRLKVKNEMMTLKKHIKKQ